MSQLPKNLGIERGLIEQIENIEDAKDYLRKLTNAVETAWNKLYNEIEHSIIAKAPNWRAIESGTKLNFEQKDSNGVYQKKAAVTGA